MSSPRFVPAALVALTLVITGQPALADPPEGPISPPPVEIMFCDPTGPNTVTWISPEVPTAPESSNIGLTLPGFTVAPVEVSATIAPAAGEDFPSITLTQAAAIPMAKILKDNVVDPEQAVLQWRLRVQQYCEATDQMETCEYVYHEMSDGSVFEVIRLAGGELAEHAGTIGCQAVGAFRAPHAPQDLGVRLVAAAKQQVPAAQIEANAAEGLGQHVVMTAGLSGIALPADVAAWAGAVATAIGLASFATGPCGAYFTTILGSEVGVWAQLLTISTAPPETRVPKATIAVLAKVASAYAALQLVPTCVAAMVGAGPALTAFIDLIMALGMIFFWSSTVMLAVYGLDHAVSYWTS